MISEGEHEAGRIAEYAAMLDDATPGERHACLCALLRALVALLETPPPRDALEELLESKPALMDRKGYLAGLKIAKDYAQRAYLEAGYAEQYAKAAKLGKHAFATKLAHDNAKREVESLYPESPTPPEAGAAPSYHILDAGFKDPDPPGVWADGIYVVLDPDGKLLSALVVVHPVEDSRDPSEDLCKSVSVPYEVRALALAIAFAVADALAAAPRRSRPRRSRPRRRS